MNSLADLIPRVIWIVCVWHAVVWDGSINDVQLLAMNL